MDITIRPNTLCGHIEAPASKSELHRALICAALSDGLTEICCGTPSADILATAECLRALGAEVTALEDGFSVKPISSVPQSAVLRCGESGSTLRFLLPVAAALGVRTEFRMSGRLALRPMEPLLRVQRENGCTVEAGESVLRLSGKLQPGDYAVDASESSQFLSGLLLALPLLPWSSIKNTGKTVSEDYVNLTMTVMSRFGVDCHCENGIYTVPGIYRTLGVYRAEGDWSAAAYWLAANALGSSIEVGGLNPKSAQGDRAAAELISEIQKGNAVIDCGNVPDLLPPLAVVAAAAKGETRFVNAARLRGKESDRLAAVSALLNALGADCSETPDGLIIQGVGRFRGATVDSFGDHRIAMAAAIAATVCDGEVNVQGAECVAKSYPDFWNDYRKLGGDAK